MSSSYYALAPHMLVLCCIILLATYRNNNKRKVLKNNFPHFWKVCHIQPCVDDLTLQVINYAMHRASRSECISMICNKIYIGVIFLMKLQPFENGTQNCGLDIQAIAPNLLTLLIKHSIIVESFFHSLYQ